MIVGVKLFKTFVLGDDEVKANCSMGLMKSFHTIDSGFHHRRHFSGGRSTGPWSFNAREGLQIGR